MKKHSKPISTPTETTKKPFQAMTMTRQTNAYEARDDDAATKKPASLSCAFKPKPAECGEFGFWTYASMALSSLSSAGDGPTPVIV